MKINQVEELTGIPKKNIRFYEDQKLVSPQRNLSNGYREYSMDDVALLNRIKLFRKLGIPIESIRKMETGEEQLNKCRLSVRKYSPRRHVLTILIRSSIWKRSKILRKGEHSS